MGVGDSMDLLSQQFFSLSDIDIVRLRYSAYTYFYCGNHHFGYVYGRVGPYLLEIERILEEPCQFSFWGWQIFGVDVTNAGICKAAFLTIKMGAALWDRRIGESGYFISGFSLVIGRMMVVFFFKFFSLCMRDVLSTGTCATSFFDHKNGCSAFRQERR